MTANMNEDVRKHLEQYPEEIRELYCTLRELVMEVCPGAEERLWAKLPSYYAGERFVRLIPFKDHINIEAAAAVAHEDELKGCRFTPKGMAQAFAGRELPVETLRQVFRETLL